MHQLRALRLHRLPDYVGRTRSTEKRPYMGLFFCCSSCRRQFLPLSSGRKTSEKIWSSVLRYCRCSESNLLQRGPRQKCCVFLRVRAVRSPVLRWNEEPSGAGEGAETPLDSCGGTRFRRFSECAPQVRDYRAQCRRRSPVSTIHVQARQSDDPSTCVVIPTRQSANGRDTKVF